MPASGVVAMLPLTPANDWTPTILFCSGSDMAADNYGNYANPVINTWDCPASQDRQRITPEPTDGSAPKYVQDDNKIQECTMPLLASISCGNVELTERSNGCICFRRYRRPYFPSCHKALLHSSYFRLVIILFTIVTDCIGK